jgi:hypothetical protein
VLEPATAMPELIAAVPCRAASVLSQSRGARLSMHEPALPLSARSPSRNPESAGKARKQRTYDTSSKLLKGNGELNF